MLSCFLSVGMLCVLGAPVSVEVGDAMIVYHGRIRQDDVEVGFDLASDDVGLDDLTQRLCVDEHCFVYEAGWVDRLGSVGWRLSVRQEGVAMDDQHFSFSAPTRERLMARIGRFALRPETGGPGIPLASFLAGAEED